MCVGACIQINLYINYIYITIYICIRLYPYVERKIVYSLLHTHVYIYIYVYKLSTHACYLVTWINIRLHMKRQWGKGGGELEDDNKNYVLVLRTFEDKDLLDAGVRDSQKVRHINQCTIPTWIPTIWGYSKFCHRNAWMKAKHVQQTNKQSYKLDQHMVDLKSTWSLPFVWLGAS